MNVDFEVEDSTEFFSVSKRKSNINIKSVESNHCINFTIFKNKTDEIFNEFCYNNVDKHDESYVYVFVILIL